MLPNTVREGGVEKTGKSEEEKERGECEVRANMSPAGPEEQATEQAGGKTQESLVDL